MPMYEYKCLKCETVFEKLQKFSDEPVKIHEGCGGEVEKQLSAPAFQFKGTGWYVTDYAKGSSTAPPVKVKEGESKSESKSESSKSDSKTSSSDSSSSSSSSSSSTPAAVTTSADKK